MLNDKLTVSEIFRFHLEYDPEAISTRYIEVTDNATERILLKGVISDLTEDQFNLYITTIRVMFMRRLRNENFRIDTVVLHELTKVVFDSLNEILAKYGYDLWDCQWVFIDFINCDIWCQLK